MMVANFLELGSRGSFWVAPILTVCYPLPMPTRQGLTAYLVAEVAVAHQLLREF